MDAAERALLTSTVRDAVARRSAAGAADEVLVDLGWHEMLASEPRDAVSIVFGALGATNAVAGVLDDVVVAALGLEPRADLAVVYPTFGHWAPPVPDGLASVRATAAKQMVVVTGERAAIVATSDVERTPIRGVDPDTQWQRVRVPSAIVGETVLDTGAWDHAVAAGRRAVAQEIAGACRSALDLACAHAVERVQFDRPIARFQAVRHRLAETLVAIEALDAAIDAAWDAPNPTTAALAKAIAGRSARTVATHCQQVLAGIGFTTDHPFHRFMKRTMALEGLFGTADEIVTQLGRELIATRSVPTLIEL